MPSPLALQTFGTSIPGFDVVASSFVESVDPATGYSTSTLLGASTLKQVFDTISPRSLIAVKSLPYVEATCSAFAMAERSGIVPSRIVSLGDQCAAIVDGLLMAALFAGSGLSPVALVVADQFAEAVDPTNLRTNASFAEWKNIAGCLRIEGGGRLYVRAVASIADPTFAFMTTFKGAYLEVNQDLANRFTALDVDNQVSTIEPLISLSQPRLGKPLLCTTNRSAERLAALNARTRNQATLIHSRQKCGHTGGADILINLKAALEAIGTGSGSIICSANGLGYTWSSLLIEVCI